MLLAAIDTQTQALMKESTAHRRETRHGTRGVNTGILALEQSLNARLDDLATQDDIHRLTQHLRWLEELFQVHMSSGFSASDDGSLLSEHSLASECEVILHDEAPEFVVPTLQGIEDFEDDNGSCGIHHGHNDLEVLAPSTQTMLELDLSLDDECCNGSLVGLNICAADEVPLAEAQASVPEETTAILADHEIVRMKDSPVQISPIVVQRNALCRFEIPLLIFRCLCLYGVYACCWWLFGGCSSRHNAQIGVKNTEGFVNNKYVNLRLE